MTDRTLAAALSLAALLLVGCRCPQTCATTAGEPSRRIGVDPRGCVGGIAVPARQRQVFLDMTFARVPEARVQQALGSDRPHRAGGSKAVTAARARALLAAWRLDPAITITSAPKIVAIPGQEASIFVGETVGFARTVVETSADVGATLDGETIRYARTEAVTNQDGGLSFSIEEEPDSPVHLGTRIRVVPTLTEDGRMLSLQIAGSWRELKQQLSPEAPAPMTAAEFETHVREHRLDASVMMPNDSWVVLGTPDWIEIDAGRFAQVTLLHAVVIGGDTPASGE